MARGDILLIELPTSSRREQSGRRPAVAVQTNVKGQPLLMVAPITSNLQALRFAFTVQIAPSPQNGLTQPSIIMIFQMRAIDKQRIVRKLGTLSPLEMEQVDQEIWRMLRPPS